jgi:hypothetical protein
VANHYAFWGDCQTGVNASHERFARCSKFAVPSTLAYMRFEDAAPKGFRDQYEVYVG